ncbi:HAD family hydrolase [Halobacillus andaensis]|uniref:HAD family hydrolase n=1 Tax=Halobacillus andaensis TaxID=1176239 RepID=UPI003D7649AD
MIRAVLFDLDGTMLNREQSLKKFAQSQYYKYIQLQQAAEESLYIARLMELDDRGYVAKEVVYDTLMEELKLKELTAGMLVEDYFTRFQQFCTPFPQLNETLTNLKQQGYKLGIITNGKYPFQHDNIRALHIDHFFNVILTSEYEGIKKPDPLIFQRALNRLRVTAEESVFVGDHPEKDVQAAVSAGMHGVLKRDDYWGDVNTEHEVLELDEVPDLLERLNLQGSSRGENEER